VCDGQMDRQPDGQNVDSQDRGSIAASHANKTLTTFVAQRNHTTVLSHTHNSWNCNVAWTQ